MIRKNTTSRDEAAEPEDSVLVNQWLFPFSALNSTPSSWPLEKQLYDRARGVEFLFRLGSSLQLPTPAMFTAATWYHRFYMRFAIGEFHRQDVAASCIFLATKTEECGRKLRDVARVCQAKIEGRDVADIPDDSKEVEACQTIILQIEEVLLEALCFDFRIDNPHIFLVDMFLSERIRSQINDPRLQEIVWTLAHDSYRTPLCILHTPRIIAAACFVLAQHLVDGPNSMSLDSRISYTPPSASLPTPPSHKAISPEVSRIALEYFTFSEEELNDLADAIRVLLDFYAAQDLANYPYLAAVRQVPPPTIGSPRDTAYRPFSEMVSTAAAAAAPLAPSAPTIGSGLTPKSTNGNFSPLSTEQTTA